MLACSPDADRQKRDGVDPTAPTAETPAPSDPTTPVDDEEPNQPLITDEGLSSGYQDRDWLSGLKRGRGNVVADFDGDGDYDVFSANPGSESFLIRNVTPPGGPLAFEPWQVLSEDKLYFGGVAADFDNDGDADLFIAAGANDGDEGDRLFRNDFGQGAPDDAPLVDISMDVRLGPQDKNGVPRPNGTMGSLVADLDNDGRLDLWADNYARDSEIMTSDAVGRNQLYLNNGGFDLVDRAIQTGVYKRRGTRNSALLDFDRDGDIDIFENNFHGGSVLWRNLLADTGVLRFVDVTETMSINYSLSEPVENQAMCALAGDLDNDGWEDLVVLNRGLEYSPLSRHLIFMNQEGQRFVEVGANSNINVNFDYHLPITGQSAMDIGWGVMGCQLGDVNLDGFPDLFMGTGSGETGDRNRLFVSRELATTNLPGIGDVTVPLFEDWSQLIDFPPPAPEDHANSYPLRSHGTAFADFDGDGIPEMSVHNGGPAKLYYVEPNRLYKFQHVDPRFLRIALEGDGVTVNRDGIGTRVRIQVERDYDGYSQDLYLTRRASTGFGAQNEPELVFGLGDADRVVDIEVTWPDGVVESVEPPEGVQNWMTITR